MIDGTRVTTCNAWRWCYPQPAERHSPGVEAAKMLRGLNKAHTTASRRKQLERKRETGFAGEDSMVGCLLVYAMRRRRRRVQQVAAHYASLGCDFVFQSCETIGGWCNGSDRTVRRANAELGDDGLVISMLLLPGEMVPGMRAPVLRPMVVRDVRPLRALVGKLTAQQRAKRGKVERGAGGRFNPSRRRPINRDAAAARSAAEPAPAPQDAFTPEEWQQELAAWNKANPLRSITAQQAAEREQQQRDANKRKTVFDPPERPSPTEIDQWEAETLELEVELEDRDTVRAPPE